LHQDAPFAALKSNDNRQIANVTSAALWANISANFLTKTSGPTGVRLTPITMGA
jgi:hypothetical protein